VVHRGRRWSDVGLVRLKDRDQSLVEGDDATTPALGRPDVDAINRDVWEIESAGIADPQSSPCQKGDGDLQGWGRYVEECEQFRVRRNEDQPMVHPREGELGQRIGVEQAFRFQPGRERSECPQVSMHRSRRESQRLVLKVPRRGTGEIGEGRAASAFGEAVQRRLVVADRVRSKATAATIDEVSGERVFERKLWFRHGVCLRRL
jgi:hypothetical protein